MKTKRNLKMNSPQKMSNGFSDFRESITQASDSCLKSLNMVEIPAGRFQMGSPETGKEGYADEGPQHPVELESFFISQTPITQAQWREVANWEEQPGERWGLALKPNPSRFSYQPDSDQRPVERVSWHDAQEFCRRLSQRTGRLYRLPSEAQWEYACRAGTSTPFHFGATLTTDLANYDGRYTYGNGPKGEYRNQTTPVGIFPANGWGLHDMHGNVLEWCQDHWHQDYKEAPADGSAWEDEVGSDDDAESIKNRLKNRLLRGGSWSCYPGYCRSAYRIHGQTSSAYGRVGFRVVCETSQSTQSLQTKQFQVKKCIRSIIERSYQNITYTCSPMLNRTSDPIKSAYMSGYLDAVVNEIYELVKED